MDRWILTAVCLGGLGFAGALTWRWRNFERVEREPLEPGIPAAKRAIRSIAVTVDAALIVGVLVTGLGSRLFMRIIAATSSDLLRGIDTDAEEPIGRVTVGGTLALIVFGGLIGTFVVALAYRLLRRWLPARGWQAGLIAVTIVMALLAGATGLLDPDSKDFEILSPLWLAVAMVLLLAAAVGVSFGVIHERLDQAMPNLQKSWSALAYLPLLLILPAVTPAVVMLAAITVAALFAPVVNTFVASPAVKRGGQLLLTAATVASLGVIGINAAKILA